MASSELLKQIQSGKKLKKAETNDRSAPIVEAPKSGMIASAGASAPSSSYSAGQGGPPQLGGLFAGGMPKLKPAGQNNLAKPPVLGKPPSVPKRDASSTVPAPPNRSTPAVPTPPTRNIPKPTLPPAINRPAPSLPSRTVPIPPSSAPTPPRRAPPPVRNTSPPAPPSRPSPAIPARNASPSPSQPSPSIILRPVPSVPSRSNLHPVHAPNRQVPTTPGRPPPPPPRPSSAGPTTPPRVVPPPPARRAPINGETPLTSQRVRALSEAEPSTAPPPPPAPPGRSSLAPPLVSGSLRGRTASVESTIVSPSQNGRAVTSNGNAPAPRRRIPSPPATVGAHIFPVADFPPPRDFQAKVRQYSSGRQRGSDFDPSSSMA